MTEPAPPSAGSSPEGDGPADSAFSRRVRRANARMARRVTRSDWREFRALYRARVPFVARWLLPAGQAAALMAGAVLTSTPWLAIPMAALALVWPWISYSGLMVSWMNGYTSGATAAIADLARRLDPDDDTGT